nr:MULTISPECIES: cupin domain-containing protein [Pseudomonas syringae group genomosp. 2]
MKSFMATSTLALMLAASIPAFAEDTSKSMSIVRNGEQASIAGSPANFVGSARIDPLFPVRAPSRVAAAYVTFQPGGRSVWHTHPLGQTLVVTAGTGWIQQEGDEKVVIKPGDVIWTPPGVKHWHGATAKNGMTHMAIQESLDGKNVEWMEPVTEAQYEASR